MRTHLPTRRRATDVAAALAVATLVMGASACQGTDADPAPQTEPTVLGEETLSIDAGELTDDEAVAACSTPGFAGDGGVDVLYAVRQLTEDGDSAVVLLRNVEGQLRLCDTAGPDSPAQQPVPEATASDPVAFLTNGRAAWDCADTSIEGYTSTSWLAVGDEVERVQQRFWVDGVAEPWFTTTAQGGYAHLQTWLTGPLPEGTKLAVQHRVLDSDGQPVAQSALGTGKRALAQCTGDDVTIG